MHCEVHGLGSDLNIGILGDPMEDFLIDEAAGCTPLLRFNGVAHGKFQPVAGNLHVDGRLNLHLMLTEAA
jgi:hypothetical protein